MKKAVVLLSGGLDSATLLYYVKNKNYNVYTLAIDYGQNHTVELEYAEKLAREAKVVEHQFVKIDLRKFKGTACGKNFSAIWPNRNLLFVTLAASYAQHVKASEIFIGSHQTDYTNFPDCRPKFYKSLQETLNFSDPDYSIKIQTPFIKLTKRQIFEKYIKPLGVPVGHTWSCYHPKKDYAAGVLRWDECGECSACKEREKMIGGEK